MPPVGFEPTISPGERPKTYVLDRAASGTGVTKPYSYKIVSQFSRISDVQFIACVYLTQLYVIVKLPILL
jgi:hypothetical protein